MFDPPLNEIADDVKKDVAKQSEDMFRALALQVFAKIVKRTPVDTGQARGGWNVSVFTPTLTPSPANKNASVTSLPKNPTLAPFWLSNPLPYIEVLEFGGYGKLNPTDKTAGTGFSTMAPRGMIRVTFSEFGL